MPSAPLTVALLGEPREVKVPRSFAEREDLIIAWKKADTNPNRSRRVFAAIVGLCVPSAGLVRDLEDFDCDVFKYGKWVYDQLRSKGAESEEIYAASLLCYRELLRETFPRKDEVAKKEDFTPAVEPPTGTH